MVSVPLSDRLVEIECALADSLYSKAIALCTDLLVEDAAIRAGYWYLGLANLLQGHEEEAQFIWMGAIAEAPADQADEWSAELADVLRSAILQQEARQEWELTWLLRRQIQEIDPSDVENALRLVQLSLMLKRLTSEDLDNLAQMLQSASNVDQILLLSTLQQVLQDLSLEPAVASVAAACVSHVAPDRLVDVLLPAAIGLTELPSNRGMAYRYGSLCYQLCPDRRDVLRVFCGIAQDDRHYDEGIALAQRYGETCETLADQILAQSLILRGWMNSGTRWAEAAIALARQTDLLNSLLDSFTPTQDCILNPSVLCTPLFFYPYFEDNPETIRPLQNRIANLYQAGVDLGLQHNLTDYQRYPHKPLVRSPSHSKLRVGFISRFFYRHSIGWLSRWTFEYFDRNQFDSYIYLVQPTPPDAFATRWFVDRATRACCFTDTRDPLGMASAIQDDEVDILVDLDSLTSEVICAVMAHKPAPIQVTWLGLDASGLPTIDYFLADPYMVPDKAQSYYSERIWRLPQTYIAVDGFEVGVPTLRRDDLNIPADAVVYLTSQFAYKRHPNTVRSKLQIIHQVPNSYLLVKGLANEQEMQSAFSAVAAKVGVNPNRLRFLPRDPDEETHRANLAIADVILDTFPYNGATTTLETLWMGIPLVTQVGKQCSARTSYTMMKNAGLTEGIAFSAEEYIHWGVRLGIDAHLRQEIGTKLMRSRLHAPLWNSRLFARQLGEALGEMGGVLSFEF